MTATRVVGGDAELLWEGEPLLEGRARPVVVAAVGRVVDDPQERDAVARATGADVVEMESGRLAASGRLVGVLRAVSDTATHPVGPVALAAHPGGRTRWTALALALAREPRASVIAIRNGRRALLALERAAREL